MAAEGPSPHVIAIAAGSSHSAAVIDCGTVVTWGRGEDGQLGHGDSAELTEPKACYNLLGKGVRAVVCGAEYTIAVTNQEESIYSWGWGDFGRLGHGDSTDVFIPRPVAFFKGIPVRMVAAGDTHTLVTTQAGELFAFGRNQNGQLGLGSTDDQLSPQLVSALQGQQVISVATGAEHSVATTSTGEVWAWGWGRYGNLGNGHQEDRHLPTRVLGLDGVHIVHANCGWRHSVVVSGTGQIYTFGWSKYGQLGHGDNGDRLTPAMVEALQDRNIVCVAGGWRHTVAADDKGNLYAWGWNKFGQLGLGDLDDRNAPTPITKMSGMRTRLLACGWRHTLAVTETGQVYTWGRGVSGQLGHGMEEDRSDPTHLSTLSTGTLDRAAIQATASPAGGYVSPEDRYAVVPGGADDGMGAAYYEVPDMSCGTAALTKKARTGDA